MRSSLATAALLTCTIVLFFVGSSFVSSGYSMTGSNLSSIYSTSSPMHKTISVSLKFSPKLVKISPGGTAKNKLTIHNSTKKTVTFTGCLMYYKKSTSKKWISIPCSQKKITIKAGHSLTEVWSTSLPKGTKAGLYDVKVYLKNSSEVSNAGFFAIKVK